MDSSLAAAITAFVSVVLIDVALAGDNAVVVGTAAAGLEPRQQRRVIAVGAGLALVLRVAFALIATELLQVAPLILVGGCLLVWVAWRLWRDTRHRTGQAEAGAAMAAELKRKGIGGAILQVAVADVSMSLDNVLAVAAAARDHPYILIFGLVFSIALMALAAQFVARLIDRFRWIAYVGVAIVLAVGLRMIWQGGHETLAQLT